MRELPPAPPSLHTLLRAFAWSCLWCGRPVVIADARRTSRAATREHLVPRARGGEDSVDNMALACSRCNNARGGDLCWPLGTPGPTDELVRLSTGHRWAWGKLLGWHKTSAPWAATDEGGSDAGDR